MSAKADIGKYDYQAQDYQLHYLRTKDGEEVDFVIVKDNVIEQLIEVKSSDHSLSPSLVKFRKKIIVKQYKSFKIFVMRLTKMPSKS